MEVSIVAVHNLPLLSDLGGICATPNKPSTHLGRNEFLPSYVRHGSVNGHKRCRLKARFFCGSDGALCSLTDAANETRGVHAPACLLVPLGRDPTENSGVIKFKMTSQGPLMSRRHCVLQLYGSCLLGIPHDVREWCALHVRDCGSLNGTFVNGRRLASGAVSPAVTFDPCDAKLWNKPLLTLELGAGAKLLAGDSLSTRQLHLQLQVFVRSLVQRPHIGWIQRLLEGRPFFGMRSRDGLSYVSFDETLSRPESVKPNEMSLKDNAFKKSGEDGGSAVLPEESLIELGEGNHASAEIHLLPSLGCVDGSTNGVVSSNLERDRHVKMDDSFCFASTVCPTRCVAKRGVPEGVAFGLASASCNTDLSSTLLECFAQLGEGKDKTLGRVNMETCAREGYPGSGTQDCSPVVVKSASCNAEFAGVLGNSFRSFQDCLSPPNTSKCVTREPPCAPRLCDENRDDDDFNSSNKLLVSLSPILLKKRTLTRRSSLAQCSQKRRRAEIDTNFLPSSSPKRLGESSTTPPLRAQSPERATAVGAELSLPVAVMQKSLGAHQSQRPPEQAGVACASFRSRDSSYSLPSSQDEIIVALPRHGVVKKEEPTTDDDCIAVNSTPSPILNSSAEEGRGMSAACTVRKQARTRRCGGDIKETANFFSDRTNWWC